MLSDDYDYEINVRQEEAEEETTTPSVVEEQQINEELMATDGGVNMNTRSSTRVITAHNQETEAAAEIKRNTRSTTAQQAHNQGSLTVQQARNGGHTAKNGKQNKPNTRGRTKETQGPETIPKPTEKKEREKKQKQGGDPGDSDPNGGGDGGDPRDEGSHRAGRSNNVAPQGASGSLKGLGDIKQFVWGQEDFNDWYDRHFLPVTFVNNWPARANSYTTIQWIEALGFCLDESAYRRYKTYVQEVLDSKIPLTFSVLVDFCKNTFGISKARKLGGLDKIFSMQQRDMDVREYYNYFIEQVNMFKGVEDLSMRSLARLFYKGLHQKYRVLLYHKMEDDNLDINNILELCENYDANVLGGFIPPYSTVSVPIINERPISYITEKITTLKSNGNGNGNSNSTRNNNQNNDTNNELVAAVVKAMETNGKLADKLIEKDQNNNYTKRTSNRSKNQEIDKTSQSKRRRNNNPDSEDETPPKYDYSQVCKFWQQGNCKFGNKCKFQHPTKNNNPSSNNNSANRPRSNQVNLNEMKTLIENTNRTWNDYMQREGEGIMEY